MEKKPFIITIDTEGDDFWSWKIGDPIKTRNVKFLPRFQSLCDGYHYKPVWLSNWEMLQNDEYIEWVKQVEKEKRCEVGVHIHAWNNPPYFELNNLSEKGGLPYLTEYPENIMEKKVDLITREYFKRFGRNPVSHRAGRWAMNDVYFKILDKYGYKVDCSVTPGISWKTSPGYTKESYGMDYSGYERKISMIGNVLEVPMSTYISRKVYFSKNSRHPIILYVYSTIKKMKEKNISYKLFRTSRHNIVELCKAVDNLVINDNSDYLMFMLHSSELMPGGSPVFYDKKTIEDLYNDLNILFDKIKDYCYGITLSEFYEEYMSKRKVR